MAPNLPNIYSLLRDGEDGAMTYLRQCSPASLREFLKAVLAHIAHAATNAKPEDVPLLSFLMKIARTEPDFFGLKNSCTILIDCSFFLEQLDNYKEGIQIGMVASQFAAIHGDKNLRRRAHNALGAHFFRTYDFGMACHHLELALRFARELSNPFYECSVLGNIATLLNAMGLHHESNRILIRCLSYSGNTAQFREIQAYNAVNALKVSRLISDNVSSDYSYQIACKQLKLKQFATNSLLHAYFEFGRALYLIDRGKQDVASRYINSAIGRYGATNNSRLNAILLTTEAICLSATGRPRDLRKAKQLLKHLLHLTKDFPEFVGVHVE